jgi:hypothetical protein
MQFWDGAARVLDLPQYFDPTRVAMGCTEC